MRAHPHSGSDSWPSRHSTSLRLDFRPITHADPAPSRRLRPSKAITGITKQRHQGKVLTPERKSTEHRRSVLDSPERISVPCVDEKSKTRTLDPTAPIPPIPPIPPLRSGLPERPTHDNQRRGTPTLLAAFNILNGKVIASCKPRHRNRKSVTFLNQLEKGGAPRPMHPSIRSTNKKQPSAAGWPAGKEHQSPSSGRPPLTSSSTKSNSVENQPRRETSGGGRRPCPPPQTRPEGRKAQERHLADTASP